MNNRPRVLVYDPIHDAGLKILRKEADVDVRTDLKPEQIPAEIAPYQALIVGPETRVNHDVIEEGLNLKVIGCAGASLDNVDVSTARALGIDVRNSPSSSAIAIAEHTIKMMLLLSTRFGDGGLANKTLGIIGFGRIGREVAQRALAFDMQVIVNQPRLTPELALEAGVIVTDMMDLLGEADFVSLHVPFKAETETLIGAEELAAMQPTAFLINTGHTDLVDEAALLKILEEEGIAGAALPEFPDHIANPAGAHVIAVREHPRVIVAPHATTIIGDRKRNAAVSIARQVVEVLRTKRPDESLSLEVVPIDQVMPHEQIDEKRVRRLMERLEEDGRLINPPLVTYWQEKYVVLDGATRFTALKWLDYPCLIVQVVDAHRDDFDLHTWYHVISSTRPVVDLYGALREMDTITLDPIPPDEIQGAFSEQHALCYFLDRSGKATLVKTNKDADRLAMMNEVVARYTTWGRVERTLLTDLSRLRGQFPDMVAVAVFPQFAPETVFDTASRGGLLPAGLTRFLIPGRILRLNADLARLKKKEPLVAKRAWFNQFLEEKLARSRVRYYQEPVILLDE